MQEMKMRSVGKGTKENDESIEEVGGSKAYLQLSRWTDGWMDDLERKREEEEESNRMQRRWRWRWR